MTYTRPPAAQGADEPSSTTLAEHESFRAAIGPKSVLTVPEAADVLGISRSLAYELVARHEIPAVRLGRRILIPHGVIEEILSSAVYSSRAAIAFRFPTSVRPS